ncbi:hypothetical protein SKAU_G00255400 [Synaphobranchus kaupii]|uniref:Uncharacterized protein n=1 Tax=Synaphobranchus kaupii TaxID=118154 RepID=A0A9Q1F3Y8_SYNKA|nr:hypothetical protein SKAU_G00255400 [Synaphobranchus kaupii]
MEGNVLASDPDIDGNNAVDPGTRRLQPAAICIWLRTRAPPAPAGADQRPVYKVPLKRSLLSITKDAAIR